MILFLLCDITIIPYLIGGIMNAIATRNIYDRTVFTHEGTDPVLLVGDIHERTLELFLSEWYHTDSATKHVPIVIISPRNPNEGTVKILQSR